LTIQPQMILINTSFMGSMSPKKLSAELTTKN